MDSDEGARAPAGSQIRLRLLAAAIALCAGIAAAVVVIDQLRTALGG